MSNDLDYPEPLSPRVPEAPEPPSISEGYMSSQPNIGPPRDTELNGAVVTRGGSRRRKPVGSSGSSQMLPIAPEAPSHSQDHPISYRDPYRDSNGHVGAKTFADRARDLAEEGTPLPSGNTPEPTSHEQVHHQQSRHHQSSQSRHARTESQAHTNRELSAEESPRMPFGGEAHEHDQYDTKRSSRRSRASASASDGWHLSDVPPSAPEIRISSVRGNANPQKVDWAVDHSPLQRLENDLLIKEKKRARVQEAEQKARERERAQRQRESQASENLEPKRASGAQISTDRGLDDLGGAKSQRQSSSTVPERSSSNRRVSSDSYATEARASEQRASRIPRPIDPQAHHGSIAPGVVTAAAAAAAAATATAGHRPRVSLDSSLPAQMPSVPNASDANKAVSAPRRRSVDDRGVRFPQNPVDASAYTSQPGPNEPSLNDAVKYDQTQAAPYAANEGTKQVPVSKGGLPFKSAAAHAIGHRFGPKYEIPPQTAAGGKARQLIGFGSAAPENSDEPTATGKRHFFPHIHHPTKETTPNISQPVRYLDEWKQASVARLLISDLTAVPPPREDDKQFTWWEVQNQGRRKSSISRQQPPEIEYFDGANEDSSQPNRFEPPLYLKCGPLLRYTGIRKESPDANAGSDLLKEFWRGSVMIVTVDDESEYDNVPTLRLFHQHLDLLPPPPVQISEEEEPLASEYVDPVAGLPKMARDGSVVYVKPAVDFDEGVDYSHREGDEGLFEKMRTANVPTAYGRPDDRPGSSPVDKLHGAAQSKPDIKGRFREVKGVRLHAERGVTFWRFNLEVELGEKQSRIAYRINKGASIGFWIPGKGQNMNIMFHSCNGFSSNVDPHEFSGPDPLWRDVLNAHQTKPFHVMIGGGDQIYNDKVTESTNLFRSWLETKNPIGKHHAEFTTDMRDELETFYLDRYSMWFSQGLFGMANSQIPMVNIWDDHDIIDGFGSYSDRFMSTPVFCGLGNVAYKYYMLFQHQSVPDELESHEPSWLLGAGPGPYINFQSRSLFLSLGRNVSFLGLDCRTERMREEVLSEHTYDLILDRCRRELVHGETKHLIVLLGVPIAYPRLVWLENILTSRALDPVKALANLGMFKGLMNKFDNSYEVLDDLDDHWTAAHHKEERQWFIQELQSLAADKSVRITILSGDVHLAAVGEFYSNKRLNIPKDRDHRYMPNIISSAIVNTPPPDVLADVLNKRDKIHHLDADTDEDMIPMFLHDVDGKKRNNKKLLPRRNWCSICEYNPGSTPPPTPPMTPTPPDTSYSDASDGPVRRRSLSLARDIRPGNLLRRLSLSNRPRSPERNSAALAGDDPERESYFPPDAGNARSFNKLQRNTSAPPIPIRPLGHFHRRPTNLSEKAMKKGGPDFGGEISLEHGLDIHLNCEIKKGDPLGCTESYRLLVPALWYTGHDMSMPPPVRRQSVLQRLNSLRAGSLMRQKNRDSITSFASRGEPEGPGVIEGAARFPGTFPARPDLPAGQRASTESIPQRPRRNSLIQRFGSLRDRLPQIGKQRRTEEDYYSPTTNDEYAPNDDAAMMQQGRKSFSSRPPISGSTDNVPPRGRRPSFVERLGSIGRRLSQAGRPKQRQYYSEDEYTETETESEAENEEDYIGSGDLTRPGRQPMASPQANKAAILHQNRHASMPAAPVKKDEDVPEPFKPRPKVAMSPPPQAQYAETSRAIQPQYADAYGSTDAMVGNRQASAQQMQPRRLPPQDNRRSGAVFHQPDRDVSGTEDDDEEDDDDDMDSIDELDSLKQVPHKRKNVSKILGVDAANVPAGASVQPPSPGARRKDMSKFLGGDDDMESARNSMSEKRSSRGYDGIEAYRDRGGKKWWQRKSGVY